MRCSHCHQPLDLHLLDGFHWSCYHTTGIKYPIEISPEFKTETEIVSHQKNVDISAEME